MDASKTNKWARKSSQPAKRMSARSSHENSMSAVKCCRDRSGNGPAHCKQCPRHAAASICSSSFHVPPRRKYPYLHELIHSLIRPSIHPSHCKSLMMIKYVSSLPPFVDPLPSSSHGEYDFGKACQLHRRSLYPPHTLFEGKKPMTAERRQWCRVPRMLQYRREYGGTDTGKIASTYSRTGVSTAFEQPDPSVGNSYSR